MTEFAVDPDRKFPTDRHREYHSTGIYVRAKDGERWGSYDIYELSRESLLAWLQSQGGNNALAENTVLILLGHHWP